MRIQQAKPVSKLLICLCRDRMYITYQDTAEQNNTNKKGTICRRETVKEDS